MRKIIVSTLLISTLLSGTVSANFQNDPHDIKTISSTTKKKTSNQVMYALYNPSDEQIKNAIAIGKKGFDSLKKFLETQNFAISSDNMQIWQPEVRLSTPYQYIALASFLASNKYESFTLKDAKMYVNYYKNSNRIIFDLHTYGDSIDYTDPIKVVLKQGNKIYQPKAIRGKEDVTRSTSWPDAPAYRATLFADFDISKIDFTKTAELIYMYAGKELSVNYKVDFSKIK